MPYVGIALLCLVVAGFCVYLMQRKFRVRTYRISYPKNTPAAEQLPKRILVLADLHNHVYGKDNEELLAAIADAKPELILIPGDMMVCGSPKHYVATDFAAKLGALGIPTYYSFGNHEHRFSVDDPEEYAEYAKRFTDAGIHILNNDTELFGTGIRIAGLTVPRACYQKGIGTKHVTSAEVEELLGGKPESNEFLILMAHNPVDFDAYVGYGAHLTVSGHMHGGIVRLPFVGGVISPQWRLFPKYDAGIYRKKERVMAVSKGLGVHTLPIRIFNIPELMVLEMVAES